MPPSGQSHQLSAGKQQARFHQSGFFASVVRDTSVFLPSFEGISLSVFLVSPRLMPSARMVVNNNSCLDIDCITAISISPPGLFLPPPITPISLLVCRNRRRRSCHCFNNSVRCTSTSVFHRQGVPVNGYCRVYSAQD